MVLFKEHRLRGGVGGWGVEALKCYTHKKKKKTEVLKLFLFSKVQIGQVFCFCWEAFKKKKKKSISSIPSLKHS